MKSYLEDFFKLIIYPIFIYLNIDMETVAILGLLMMIDSSVGMMRSIRLGERFEFRMLIWGVCLKIAVLIIPVSLALMAKGVNYDLTIFIDMVLRIMIVSETYSIFGNIYSARTKSKINKVDMVSLLLFSLRKRLYFFFKKAIKSIESSTDCELKGKEEDNLNQL